MKSNDNNLRYKGYFHDQSYFKRYDEFNILEPAPDINLNFIDDDDEKLSKYALMDDALDLDYEE